MKITKLVHSCLLVEQDGKRLLADPGSYSWNSGEVKDEHMSELDTVVVTHAHPDHLNKDFAEAIKRNSPQARWYGPKQVVNQLAAWGIEGSSASDEAAVRFIESQHADLSPWFGEQPEHTSFVVFGDLLLGGDCHTLTDRHGAKFIAGAINGGPWGAVVGFAKMIESMDDRPQVVLPLHDWHWNETARQAIYDQLPAVLAKFDVQFMPLENGVTIEI